MGGGAQRAVTLGRTVAGVCGGGAQRAVTLGRTVVLVSGFALCYWPLPSPSLGSCDPR